MIIDITGSAQLQTCQEFGRSMGDALHFRLRKVACESAGEKEELERWCKYANKLEDFVFFRPDGFTVCSMSVNDEVLGKVLLTSY